MKFVCISLLCTTLLSVDWVDQPKGVVSNQSGSVIDRPSTSTIQKADQTVVAFLQWYKVHSQALNRIPLVDQQAGKPYVVNFRNGERYLAYLKSSRFLTDNYLNQWRTFFRERNEGFRLSMQQEGIPTGFDYDLVLLTQEVNKQLASLKAVKIDKVTASTNKASVILTLLDTYEFRLIRQKNQWLINDILNMSQE